MENYNFDYFILDLLLTIFVYCIVPIILRIVYKKPYTLKHARIISIANSICAYFIFIFLDVLLENEGTSSVTPTLFYYFINNWILRIGNKKNQTFNNDLENSWEAKHKECKYCGHINNIKKSNCFMCGKKMND